ncbi:PEPxxWA-CTERM sorting domain-containing protein [Sphingobium nicotianae]|uniref:PEP-CTERM sorting domain-containing protein n=1 Tax=Sphingobium nicotianae TaxID=2782607 RepID=A0A9X1AIA0_9SPHN|nr:PEPxxWA-CTERM sorting domain-containing protein [Sphingobium nicotianae]MBT2185787.1 PEP-CTERM sorting domain-containing protein [Sphingobium nicotianae]
MQKILIIALLILGGTSSQAHRLETFVDLTRVVKPSPVDNPEWTHLGVYHISFAGDDYLHMSVSGFPTDSANFVPGSCFECVRFEASGGQLLINYIPEYYGLVGIFDMSLGFSIPLNADLSNLGAGKLVSGYFSVSGPARYWPNYGGFGPVIAAYVPEPATWAMMISGFALAGAAMRRRKAAVRFA